MLRVCPQPSLRTSKYLVVLSNQKEKCNQNIRLRVKYLHCPIQFRVVDSIVLLRQFQQPLSEGALRAVHFNCREGTAVDTLRLSLRCYDVILQHCTAEMPGFPT